MAHQETTVITRRTDPDLAHTDQKSRIRNSDYATFLLLLGGLTALVHLYHVEEHLALPKVMLIILVAAAVQALLPLFWRLPLLIAATITAAFLVTGPMAGAILIATAFAIISITFLPLNSVSKAVILGILTAILVAARAGWIPFPQARIVLPYIGSFFMFRMLLYGYEIRTGQSGGNSLQRIHYFFMLPNLAFTIFPVIDLATYQKSYYARPAYQIYTKGIRMVANGILHLLLYRWIYSYLLPAPTEVHDLTSLTRFMVFSYALIVRLAGLFHFSAGVICLFGFDLPAVFHHYFFARNFSDIWRRINIYWRDFMTKVFYYPIFFRIKSMGTLKAMIVAILVVFGINWFLHAWQWFWIRGSFPLTLQDILFWAFFGIAVALNTWWQARHPIRRPPSVFNQAIAWKTSFQVIGMFLIMATLWSWWTSDSPQDWWILVGHARQTSVSDICILAAFVLALAALGTLYQWYAFHSPGLALTKIGRHPLLPPMAMMGILFLTAHPSFRESLSRISGMDISPVYRTQLNAYDRERQFKGYYENLLGSSNLQSPLEDLERKKTEDSQQLGFSGAGIRREDIMLKELKPNQRLSFKGGEFTTNSMGLRDREYTLEKPPRTIRIALMGGSIEMGVGVDTKNTYENLAENWINTSGLFGEDVKVEILNYGISGNHLFQNVAMFEQKAIPAKPDVLLYAAHANETHRILYNIYKAYATGRDLRYPYLKDLMKQNGLKRAMRETEFMATLQPMGDSIARQGYRILHEMATTAGALPVWMYVPTLEDNEIPGEAERLEAEARSLGYHTFRMDKAFRGHDPGQLMLAEWDTHPNNLGHELLAREWVRKWKENPEWLKAVRRHTGIE